MEKKIRLTCVALAAIGAGLALFIGGYLLEIVPNDPYKGVFWLVMMPTILYYMQQETKRVYILNMLLSYCVGLVWGFISVSTTQMVKMAGGSLLFTFVEYGVLTALIVFTHAGLLKNTLFNKPSCAFLGLALSVAASTNLFWSGNIDYSTGTLITISNHWNQLNLLIIFLCGCGILWLEETLGGIFIKAYLKKGLRTGENRKAEESA